MSFQLSFHETLMSYGCWNFSKSYLAKLRVGDPMNSFYSKNKNDKKKPHGPVKAFTHWDTFTGPMEVQVPRKHH